jgi:predicted RNA methylase
VTNATACNELADYEWLTGGEAADLIQKLATDSPAEREPAVRKLERLRSQSSPARTRLILNLLVLRQRAATKFAAAANMFFTPTLLQQATDQWVAAYKAQRLAEQRREIGGLPRVADLCCGIGGDLLAIAATAPVVAVDRDPIAALFAAANARAVLPPETAAHIDFRAQDVDERVLDGVAAWHMDPDRRPGGRRTASPEWSSPDARAIERLLSIVPHAAVKLAPAARPPGGWADRCELEWISRDGECKQLVAWHGALARSPGQRRATLLSANAHPVDGAGGPLRTLVGSAHSRILIASQADRFVFDVDAAVLAAKLKGTLAAERGLSALSPGATYLTGPDAITDDPALACFETLDVLPIRVRKLAPALHQRGIGRLAIKKRGVDIDPDELRRSLALRGENEATLLITRIAGRPVVILARRRTRNSSTN